MPVVTKEQTQEINLSLAVVQAISPPGYTWTYRDLAEICNCSKSLLQINEQSALRKIRNKPAIMRQLNETKI